MNAPAVSRHIVNSDGSPMAYRPAPSVYRGADRHSQNIGLWRPINLSANAEVARDGSVIRARARDLSRNHPNATQAVRIIAQGVCGHRMRLNLKPNYKFLSLSYDEATAWARVVEQLWESYAHGSHFAIDASRRLNFTGLMRLAIRSRFVDGEGVMAVEWDPGRKWSTCFRTVDVDRLSMPDGSVETQQFRAGIELDDLGAPKFYHIRHSHPHDEVALRSSDAFTWKRVARETPWGRPVLLHFYAHDRAEQMRGVSEFSPVIELMRMSEEYARAELASARAQAEIAAVITTDANYATAANVLGGSGDSLLDGSSSTAMALSHMKDVAEFHRQADITFDGNKIPVLLPGEKLDLVSAGHPSSQYADYQNHLDKKSSAGLGADPAALSQNYADVSYSAARMSNAQNWRTYVNLRQELIDNVAMPMVRCWAEEGVSKGIIPMPGTLSPADFYDVFEELFRGTFITSGQPKIDPTKENNANKTALEMNATTLERICAQEGLDYTEVMEQRAREIKQAQELGIDPWESDPSLLHNMTPDTLDNNPQNDPSS